MHTWHSTRGTCSRSSRTRAGGAPLPWEGREGIAAVTVLLYETRLTLGGLALGVPHHKRGCDGRHRCGWRNVQMLCAALMQRGGPLAAALFDGTGKVPIIASMRVRY